MISYPRQLPLWPPDQLPPAQRRRIHVIQATCAGLPDQENALKLEFESDDACGLILQSLLDAGNTMRHTVKCHLLAATGGERANPEWPQHLGATYEFACRLLEDERQRLRELCTEFGAYPPETGR